MFENDNQNENEEFNNGIYNSESTEFAPIITPIPQEDTKVVEEESKKSGNGKILVLAIIISIVTALTFSAAGSAITYFALKNNTSSVNESTTSEQIVKDIYLSEESMNTAQVAQVASPSVVAISTESVQTSMFMQQYVTSGAGSGVIISEDGYIVTNNHVIDGVSTVTVETYDGTEYSARLVGTDSENDIAVIKIDATGLTPAEYGDSDEIVVGQKAIAIGNPLGTLGGTVTEGIVSALDREVSINGQDMKLLQTSAAINPGNSGGGLFDENGKLIGIVNAKSAGSEIEGLGFAIPINNVKDIINDLIETGSTSSAASGNVKLGITVVDISDSQTAAMYRVDSLGVYVVKVDSGSNADNAGLQTGDRIISINGKDIESSDDISSIISEASAGENMEITFARNGQEYTVTILLAASNLFN